MSHSPTQFNLLLVDVQKELCNHWEEYFSDYTDVKIHHGYFHTVSATYECMVSPANSFGLMDGGIDLAIRNYFGMRVQYNVRKKIMKEYYGEQPVGTSMIIDTEHEDCPLLAHTPTMRVPTDISNTDHVYDAMFAMLRAVANHNKTSPLKIKTVLCPGLGTATGCVPLEKAARQMALAWHNFKNPTTNLTWKNLMKRNQIITGK
jgi:O-acetyl-ADP-ribose deacetylase (regulator of RNase III)